MNKLITFTGGKPDFNIDDMIWNDEATRNSLNDVFRAFGDNYIIYGVVGTTTITAGYIMLDGELLKVDAHTKYNTHFAKVTTYDAGGDVTFNDGVARQTWQKNRATISAASGSLAYASAERLNEVIVTLNKASTVEAQALTIDTKFITPSTLSDVNGGTLLKVVQIGDWNMDAASSVTVTHGLDFSKIIGILDVMIIDDGDARKYTLATVNAALTNMIGTGITEATTTVIYRLTGGLFDDVEFDSTSYNRGWITYICIP